jgi:anti-sigma regulatory factor (Ser/Thr protein kinase)
VDEGPHKIEVRMECTVHRLTATITDDGIPFNPLNMEQPDTDADIDNRIIGGLGIHLVRNLMDEVSYQRRIKNNILTLVKYLDQEAQSSTNPVS